MSVFKWTRDRVEALEAARFYGVTFDRKGWALCPFHHDRHASMSFRDGRYRCWSCGAHGDAVDLTAHLFGLSPMEAVSRLNTDFGLDLPLGRKMTEAEKAKAQRQREIAEAHKKFEEWRKNLLSDLAAAYRVGFLALKSGKPLETYTPQEVLSTRAGEMLNYYSDVLAYGTADEQAQIYRERRLIEECISQILREYTALAG